MGGAQVGRHSCWIVELGDGRGKWNSRASNPAITFASLETVDKGHGRLEIRRYHQSTDLGWFADLKEWEGLQSVGMVESIREIKGVQSIERRYYLSSLELNVKQFAIAVPDH